MELKEKQEKMLKVFNTLEYENYNFTKINFDSVALIREKEYSMRIEICSNGNFLVTSGDELLALQFSDISQMFDTIYFVYHCLNSSK